MLLPYLQIQPTEKQTLLLVDVYAFLERLWPVGAFPAPDTTPRNGCRLFFSHIDGDGLRP